jgi:serine/threonine-protein kinase HipA
MNRCLSRLSPLDAEGFSHGALARMSDGRKFPSALPFTRADLMEMRTTVAKKLSISGVQEKFSLRLHRGQLELVESGGQFILKPIPGQELPRLRNDVPANEHLTMQLAEQVFGIETAANALIRLADGEFAYITRRFDRTLDGEKLAQEDFCQLMGRTPEYGKNFKYDSSYEELGYALERFCPAYRIEMGKLFERIVFNYLIGNGDAHLKNFSLYQKSQHGDYFLTPAYDLMSTAIHLPGESRTAMPLFGGDTVARGLETHGFYVGSDFEDLGQAMGLSAKRTQKLMYNFRSHAKETEDLIDASFMSDVAKAAYQAVIAERRRLLAISA